VAYEAYERCQLDMLYNYNVSQKVYKLGLPSPAVSVKGWAVGIGPPTVCPGSEFVVRPGPSWIFF